MTDAEFREMLVGWMQRENLSADNVAEIVCVSVSTVRRWREGTTAPRPIIQRFVMKQIDVSEAVQRFAELPLEKREEILDRHVQRALRDTGPRIVGGVADMKLPMSDRAKQILADPKKASALLRHVTGEDHFQKQLKAVMLKHRIFDLEEIAKRCDVAVTTVFRWLEGTTAPHKLVQEGILDLVKGNEV